MSILELSVIKKKQKKCILKALTLANTQVKLFELVISLVNNKASDHFFSLLYCCLTYIKHQLNIDLALFFSFQYANTISKSKPNYQIYDNIIHLM